MDRPGRRALTAGLALAIASVLVSTSAGAVRSRAVSLTLHGGKAGAPGSSCGVHAHWAYFKRGGTVRFSGRVTPAPAARTQVKVTVWRCYTPRFAVVETQTARTSASGAYAGSFPVHARSDCYVQVRLAGSTSKLAYFRVR